MCHRQPPGTTQRCPHMDFGRVLAATFLARMGPSPSSSIFHLSSGQALVDQKESNHRTPRARRPYNQGMLGFSRGRPSFPQERLRFPFLHWLFGGPLALENVMSQPGICLGSMAARAPRAQPSAGDLVASRSFREFPSLKFLPRSLRDPPPLSMPSGVRRWGSIAPRSLSDPPSLSMPSGVRRWSFIAGDFAVIDHVSTLIPCKLSHHLGRL